MLRSIRHRGVNYRRRERVGSFVRQPDKPIVLFEVGKRDIMECSDDPYSEGHAGKPVIMDSAEC